MSAPLKLAPAQWRALEWLAASTQAWEFQTSGPCGVGTATLHILSSRGLIETAKTATVTGREVDVYRIADAGRAALAEREAAK